MLGDIHAFFKYSVSINYLSILVVIFRKEFEKNYKERTKSVFRIYFANFVQYILQIYNFHS